MRTLILRLQCNCPIKSSEWQPMKKLALIAIIVMAGCATTSDSDPRLAQLEKKRVAVAESEKRCIDETLSRSRDKKIAGTAATPDASVESQEQSENDERDREVSQCHASADQENAEIAEQERNEYESQAQQERNRASFFAILTASRLH